MSKSVRRLISTGLTVAVFFAGIGAGTYYHNEINVVWQSFSTQPEPVAAEPQVEGEQSDISVVELPGLDEPLPLVYSDTLDEEVIQRHLKEGAVVLPLGTAFGDPGNVVVTAHSSGTEAFGPYRFAFAKLAELEVGNEYTIATPTARYTYRVYDQEVVWPHQVDKLPNDDRSTVTLVTCWPLWTNFKRLLVHTELVNIEYNV